ncbi:rhodanese-like domain-containing protein [Methylobacterium phyllosphaerae]
MTMTSAKDLVAQANREVETLSAEEALARLGQPGTVFVDVREGEELAKTGRIAGAVHVPRGVLEFQADPASPSHKAELGSGRRLVLYCASGNRSALSAKALNDMGLGPVAHVAGGFPALEKAGAAVDPAC